MESTDDYGLYWIDFSFKHTYNWLIKWYETNGIYPGVTIGGDQPKIPPVIEVNNGRREKRGGHFDDLNRIKTEFKLDLAIIKLN